LTKTSTRKQKNCYNGCAYLLLQAMFHFTGVQVGTGEDLTMFCLLHSGALYKFVL